MALTTAQLNAHIRTMITDRLALEGSDVSGPALRFLLRACADHANLGGADNQEAAKTAAQFLFETVIGRPATANDLHMLRNHIAPDVGGAGLF